MSVQQFSVVCKDISNQQKFVFMNQSINFQDSNFEIVNVTKSIQINNILSTFLNNTIIFIKTKSGDLNVGCYPHSFSSQEVFVQSSQIEGNEVQSIEIVYQRLSSSELDQINPPQSQKQLTNTNHKRPFKKPFKQVCIVDDESASGSSSQYNHKRIKTESFNSNKIYQEDLLEGLDEGKYHHTQKCKASSNLHSQFTNTSSNQLAQQNNNYPSFMSTSDSLSKNDEVFEPNQSNQINTSQNNNLTRSKERTIGSAIKIVSQWRDLYEKYKEERIFRDLQEIAEEIGLSKKVLDYYFLELRTAEFFGFDFDSHLEQKFGKIRKYNNSHKQAYIQQNNNKKIPINGNFNYRINQYKPNKVNPNCIAKPFKITTINKQQWQSKYEHQNPNLAQSNNYNNHQYNSIYNMQRIYL